MAKIILIVLFLILLFVPIAFSCSNPNFRFKCEGHWNDDHTKYVSKCYQVPYYGAMCSA